MMNSILKIAFLFVSETTAVTATNTTYTTTTDTTSVSAASSKTVRKLHRRPDSERQLGPLIPAHRKLYTEEDVFTRAFTVITSSKDITFITPPNLQDSLTLQGSYIITYGGVYRSSSVELVPTELMNLLNVDSQQVLQPKTTPAIDEDFTLGGKCTSTNGKTLTGIISHSCFYDLCLGSPTDCINIYAGGRFNFQPIQDFNLRGILVNTENNGLLDPEVAGDNGFVRQLQGVETFSPTTAPSTVFPSAAVDSNAPSSQPTGRPTFAGTEQPTEGSPDFLDVGSKPLSSRTRAALPPSFPGFGFGGTGRYHGIKCNFDLITVAQRTLFPLTISTEAPTTSPTLTDEPTENKNNGRDLSQEDEQQEEEENNRELQRDGDFNSGVIVQKIFFTCNQRLPLGPKAI